MPGCACAEKDGMRPSEALNRLWYQFPKSASAVKSARADVPQGVRKAPSKPGESPAALSAPCQPLCSGIRRRSERLRTLADVEREFSRLQREDAQEGPQPLTAAA